MNKNNLQIKGLSLFHKKALEKNLNKCYAGSGIEIEFNGEISLKRMSSFWYGGNMVSITYKGYDFHIDACGEIRASLFAKPNDKEVCECNDRSSAGLFKQNMAPYFRSDKVLNESLNGGHHLYWLAIDNNNWWECFVTDPNGNFHDLMWALSHDSLFEAVAEVIGNLDEIIKNIKEDEAE
jgi:hypothetical protein